MVASEPRCTRICPVRGRLSSSGNVMVITIGDLGVSFFLDMSSSLLKLDTDNNGGYPLPFKSNRAPSGAVLLCIPLFNFGESGKTSLQRPAELLTEITHLCFATRWLGVD